MSVECRELESQIGEYVHVSTLTLVNHHWAGPSVIAHLAPDSMPNKAALFQSDCTLMLVLCVCETLSQSSQHS